MTVADLIAELKKVPPHRRVLLTYEAGYPLGKVHLDIHKVVSSMHMTRIDDEWVKHEDADVQSDDTDSDKNVACAVLV